MRHSFDAAGFVKTIGDELVRAFQSARTATTPGLVGNAIEAPVRGRLEQVLPLGIGVGSGCVIDVDGNTSRQLDVVLFEKGICPVFCVNNSPETTYFPCEGVLAVGEVKSAIDKEKLADAFAKIASVKSMRRAFRSAWGGYVCGRPYGENSSTTSYGFELEHTNLGDIFGFIVAGESRVAIAPTTPDHATKTLTDHYVDNVNATGNDIKCPDMVAVLDGTIIVPVVKKPGAEASRDMKMYTPTRHKNVLPHVVVSSQSESPFGELLKLIWGRHQIGLTANIPLEAYLGGSFARLKHAYGGIAHAPSPAEVAGNANWFSELETPTDHIRNGATPLHTDRG